MPGRIFGLPGSHFGRVSGPQQAPVPAASHGSHPSKPAQSSLEVQRPAHSMEHFKRPALGLTKKHTGSSSDKKAKKDRSASKDKPGAPRSPVKPKPIVMDLLMESPPILMLDSASVSSGALISGRLQVTPQVSETILESIVMFLECTTATKRPVQERCRECMTQVQDLYEWKFLAKPKFFGTEEGVQELPFSHLIPGHLPATTHGTIGSIDYSLHVRARSADGQEVEFRRNLVINRALRPANDKSSIRVFPPTNLSLHVTMPNVVHPIGEFPVSCRMTGITTRREDTQTRWKLRKITWRVEEHEKTVSPACPAHAAKVGGEGKGIQNEHTRDVGMGELKSGWKTDYSDGVVEGEFTCTINPSSKPQCGVESRSGHKITHNLILELVIGEEWAPNKKPESATPTGAARVLRTQFSLNVTERSGMGIAWDDEQPPMYDDVPDSPPHYQNERTMVMNYDAADLHEDIEDMTLTS